MYVYHLSWPVGQKTHVVYHKRYHLNFSVRWFARTRISQWEEKLQMLSSHASLTYDLQNLHTIITDVGQWATADSIR